MLLFFALLLVATWLTSSFLSAAAWVPTSWHQHLSCAASGASDAPHGMPKLSFSVASDDAALLEFQAKSWQDWRVRFPSRAHGKPLLWCWPRRVYEAGGACTRPWRVYEAGVGGSITQQWVMVPTLLPAFPEPTQPHSLGLPEKS